MLSADRETPLPFKLIAVHLLSLRQHLLVDSGPKFKTQCSMAVASLLMAVMTSCDDTPPQLTLHTAYFPGGFSAEASLWVSIFRPRQEGNCFRSSVLTLLRASATFPFNFPFAVSRTVFAYYPRVICVKSLCFLLDCHLFERAALYNSSLYYSKHYPPIFCIFGWSC